jgi:thioredoxin-like negative regulator of GroEL
VLARRGFFEEGETLVRDALELIGRAEDPDSHAAVWADLAEVLMAAGRLEGAQAALKNAASIFEAKGNVVSAATTRERLTAFPDEGPSAGA